MNAGGKVFTNFEHETFSQLTFAQAFAHSCNTAFIQMAETLPKNALKAMAERFGFNATFRLP